ncbi:hypothetical protein G9A89_007879 [Geosiphon pyriformis]|nr:hypothetical protein G9A89_007879 [Geosiphon pyriformis]
MGNTASKYKKCTKPKLKRSASVTLKITNRQRTISSASNSTLMGRENIETVAEDEVDRLQLQHYLTRYVWTKNFLSPLNEILQSGANVLDVKCGPGTWICEMATEYPKSKFTGIDIIPIFPKEIKPSNTKFLEWKILDGLPFQSETFDFVYQSFDIFGFTREQLSKVIGELVRVTKHEGYIELVESDMNFINGGIATLTVLAAYQQLLENENIDPKISTKLAQYLKDTKSITDITYQEISIPIGSWGGRMGDLAKEEINKEWKNLRKPLTNFLDITNEEFSILYSEMEREFDEQKTSIPSFRIYAKKI